MTCFIKINVAITFVENVFQNLFEISIEFKKHFNFFVCHIKSWKYHMLIKVFYLSRGKTKFYR